VPAAAFLPEYSRAVNFASTFALLRDFRTATAVASWPVRRGEVVGFTGDSGYSEAPHLHYAIRPANSENAFCPTTEPGFPNNGWLLR
jgi:murein DD-endopeptidase MepM/ murein hydrolase activator NlpD